MPTKEIAGKPIEVDGDGFMVDYTQWDEKVARELAKEVNIGELTDRHFDVLKFMRKEFIATGTGASLRALKNKGGIPTKELYNLFPQGPAKKAALVAGIPKPQTCV